MASVLYARSFMEVETVRVCKDTAASVEASTVFPGFKFSPTDVELISFYLKRKMDGLERSVEVIPDADIYNFEPWDLPGLSSFDSFASFIFEIWKTFEIRVTCLITCYLLVHINCRRQNC